MDYGPDLEYWFVGFMNRISITCIVWLALVLRTLGDVGEIFVTPASLDQGQYRFAVSVTSTAQGATFHVTVTDNKGGLRMDPNAGLYLVSSKLDPNNGLHQIEDLKPPVPKVVVQAGESGLKADFKLPQSLLDNPDLCLIFSAQVGMMPSVMSYEIRLGDFLKH